MDFISSNVILVEMLGLICCVPLRICVMEYIYMLNLPGRKVQCMVVPILNGSLEKENIQYIDTFPLCQIYFGCICLFLPYFFSYYQAIDIQLGMAIDSTKATLAVKRRLACEMVKCWQQV